MTIYPIPVLLFVPQTFERLHALVYVADFNQLQIGCYIINLRLHWLKSNMTYGSKASLNNLAANILIMSILTFFQKHIIISMSLVSFLKVISTRKRNNN